MKTTITKGELVKLLSEVDDDEFVYFHARTAEANLAVAVAKRGGGDELFFRLSGDIVHEADGVSLVGDFKWAD